MSKHYTNMRKSGRNTMWQQWHLLMACIDCTILQLCLSSFSGHLVSLL
ncbi:hypothetical protein E2C01_082679 [Portunus trituberculatus]|uniref:Uncharacterized protein n=1 Tax=Portunus trituberculatus TaxID=210409 RepID=A0A5B7IZX7_PORTR|nr:hypothetical protein [Portunus trituberculatus]